MGGSKNRGTPKWMVYNGKPWKTLSKWIIWIDLGVPLFSETSRQFSHGTYLLTNSKTHHPNARSMYGELITPRFLPTFTNPINYLSRRYIDSLGILLKIFVPSPPSPNIFKNHPKSAVVSLAVCPERSCEIAK